MAGAATEGTLREWRYGQAQAERLTAALLHLEGFVDVDPQHPLGGPDGLKDVLCRKEGILWVAAAYFPPTVASYSDVRNKFNHDILGIKVNGAQGFSFFVNQHLTIGERQALIALSPAERIEIYHLERITSLLNAPKGCGIRLEYLRIAMTEPEQWAFWSTMNADIVRRLADNEVRRDTQLQEIGNKLNLILARTSAIEADLHALPSSIATPPRVVERMEMPTSLLSMTMLCWLHRIVTEDAGISEAVRGRLRAVQVWIGEVDSMPANAAYTPPPPEQIVSRTTEFLVWWHKKHVELRTAAKLDVIIGLADFHHRFLLIHPFLDANGRVARMLLDQAARELLNQGIGGEFTANPSEYYAALRQADEGDLQPLAKRLTASLE